MQISMNIKADTSFLVRKRVRGAVRTIERFHDDRAAAESDAARWRASNGTGHYTAVVVEVATLNADHPALTWTHPDGPSSLCTIPAGTLVEIDEAMWDSDEGTRYSVSALVGTFRAYGEVGARYLTRDRRASLVVNPSEIEVGDIVTGWTSDNDELVDVVGESGSWTVDAVYVRPEDAPSYRRHRHGEVQVCFADSYIAFDETTPISVLR